MKITKRHLPKSQYKRPMIQANKTHITVHSTGNDNSTAKNEVDYLHNPNNRTYTSYHYAVGEDVIYEVIPPYEVAYHSGNRYGNWHSIGIEMVHTGDRKKVLDNTLWLVEKLMKDFHIPKSKVVRHYDWVMRENGHSYQKNCPSILNTDGKWTKWKEFTNRIGKRSVLDTMTKEELRALIQEEISKAINPSKYEGGLGMYAEPHFINLNARGIKVHDKRYADLITRGEVLALLGNLTDPNTLPNVIDHANKHKDK